MQKELQVLSQKLEDKFSYGNIIGKSREMRKLFSTIDAVKDSDATVLITGETGTGKELIANAIHYNSVRKNNSMISINCAAIPKALIERELFGHVKGAFTDAGESRKGYFEEADKGTIFLDEIGEMSMDMQVKLLRVIERDEIIRIGDSKPIKIDVRILAATNRDLRKEVGEGNFREDLYYRIYVLPVNVPPLKKRREDIPILIDHFVRKIKAKQNKEIAPFTKKEMKQFMDYAYPGNVRELEYLVERYAVFGGSLDELFPSQSKKPTPIIKEIDMEAIINSDNPLKTGKTHIERNILMGILQKCNYDYNEASKILNIGIASLYRKIKEYKIKEGANVN